MAMQSTAFHPNNLNCICLFMWLCREHWIFFESSHRVWVNVRNCNTCIRQQFPMWSMSKSSLVKLAASSFFFSFICCYQCSAIQFGGAAHNVIKPVLYQRFDFISGAFTLNTRCHTKHLNGTKIWFANNKSHARQTERGQYLVPTCFGCRSGVEAERVGKDGERERERTAGC